MGLAWGPSLGQKQSMLIVTVAFFIATSVIGVSQLFLMETPWSGLSFLLGGIFAYWAGSSLKLALYAPNWRVRGMGVLIAALFTTCGTAGMLATGTSFDAFGHPMPGYAWILAGLIAGIQGTKRRIYLSVPDASEK